MVAGDGLVALANANGIDPVDRVLVANGGASIRRVVACPYGNTGSGRGIFGTHRDAAVAGNGVLVTDGRTVLGGCTGDRVVRSDCRVVLDAGNSVVVTNGGRLVRRSVGIRSNGHRIGAGRTVVGVVARAVAFANRGVDAEVVQAVECLGVGLDLHVGDVELRTVDGVGAGVADAPGRHVLQLALDAFIHHDRLAVGVARDPVRRARIGLVDDVLAEGHHAGVGADRTGDVAGVSIDGAEVHFGAVVRRRGVRAGADRDGLFAVGDGVGTECHGIRRGGLGAVTKGDRAFAAGDGVGAERNGAELPRLRQVSHRKAGIGQGLGPGADRQRIVVFGDRRRAHREAGIAGSRRAGTDGDRGEATRLGLRTDGDVEHRRQRRIGVVGLRTGVLGARGRLRPDGDRRITRGCRMVGTARDRRASSQVGEQCRARLRPGDAVDGGRVGLDGDLVQVIPADSNAARAKRECIVADGGRLVADRHCVRTDPHALAGSAGQASTCAIADCGIRRVRRSRTGTDLVVGRHHARRQRAGNARRRVARGSAVARGRAAGIVHGLACLLSIRIRHGRDRLCGQRDAGHPQQDQQQGKAQDAPRARGACPRRPLHDCPAPHPCEFGCHHQLAQCLVPNLAVDIVHVQRTPWMTRRRETRGRPAAPGLPQGRLRGGQPPSWRNKLHVPTDKWAGLQ